MTTAAPTASYTPPTDGLQVGSGIDSHGFYVLRYSSKDKTLIRHYDNGKRIVERAPAAYFLAR